MGEKRPNFDDITSFDEFIKYYWYREELMQICKSLGLEYRGTKQELNNIIEQYFKGNLIKKRLTKNKKVNKKIVTLNSSLLECGFSFNSKFREYFYYLTKYSTFTIRDLLNVYYGDLDYAKYDNSACQWNQFLKDFCADENSYNYSNKLKVASVLWKEVRDSKGKKIYSKDLLTKYAFKIREYHK